MPRPSFVDIDHTLDAAMAVFWARGYAGASIEDLVEATGVARYGLYATFGDKRGLYLAALERYQQVIVNRLFAGVEARDANFEQVRGYFDGLLAMAGSDQGRLGCLMVNASIETAPGDDDVALRVNAYRVRLAGGFNAALRRARKPLSGDALAALVFGLQTQARAGAEVAILSEVVVATLGRAE